MYFLLDVADGLSVFGHWVGAHRLLRRDGMLKLRRLISLCIVRAVASTRHGIGAKTASITMDGLGVGLPVPEVLLGGIEHITCSIRVLEWLVHIARDDRSVIK